MAESQDLDLLEFSIIIKVLISESINPHFLVNAGLNCVPST